MPPRSSSKSSQNAFLSKALHALDGVTSTQTRAGWCLRQGLEHIHRAQQGSLAPLVDQHGPPSFYSCIANGHCRHEATQNFKDPSTCFQSLCRTISGQSVSGFAAQAVWKRLLGTVQNELTPESILQLVSSSDLVETKLQKPAGLSRAKARSIVDLACHFRDGKLSEEFLTDPVRTEEDIRQALLEVRGVGPWSCDMFLIFYLERPNILPLGDLGVRKGLQQHFRIRGSLAKGQICHKKDAAMVRERLQEFQPYHSLLSYYMWRAIDVPLAIDNGNDDNNTATATTTTSTKPKSKAEQQEGAAATEDDDATTPSSPLVLRRKRPRPSTTSDTTAQVPTTPVPSTRVLRRRKVTP